MGREARHHRELSQTEDIEVRRSARQAAFFLTIWIAFLLGLLAGALAVAAYWALTTQ